MRSGERSAAKHTSIHLLLSHYGGIVPSVRRRSTQVHTLAEREDISRGIASGSSFRAIATRLSRATSTVSREVARHGGRSECFDEADGSDPELDSLFGMNHLNDKSATGPLAAPRTLTIPAVRFMPDRRFH